MATQYSDIYIDGITTEELYAEGGRIVEAWLNGECIWRLSEWDNMVVRKVYQVVCHNKKYYVLFLGGIPLNGNGWKESSFYIGSGEQLGIITDIEKIKSEDYIYGYNQEDYIAAETEKGLFVYYASGYSVGSAYMFFEDYNIHDEKTLIDESPFNERSKTLFTRQSGIWLNAVMTDKYIFYCGVDHQTYAAKLYITDIQHRIIKEISGGDGENGGFGINYISANGGDKIYFHCPHGDSSCNLNYGTVDIVSLEYNQEAFDFGSMAEEMLDDFIEANGDKYERPDMSEITISGEVEYIYALSSGKYINARISFLGSYLNKATKKEETFPFTNRVVINIDNSTYVIGDFQVLYDLGGGYMLAYYEGLGRVLSYKTNIITDKWPMLMWGPEKINAVYKNGFYMYGAEGTDDKNHDYIVDYNRTSCTIAERPDFEIKEE